MFFLLLLLFLYFSLFLFSQQNIWSAKYIDIKTSAWIVNKGRKRGENMLYREITQSFVLETKLVCFGWIHAYKKKISNFNISVAFAYWFIFRWLARPNFGKQKINWQTNFHLLNFRGGIIKLHGELQTKNFMNYSLRQFFGCQTTKLSNKQTKHKNLQFEKLGKYNRIKVGFFVPKHILNY